MRPLAPLVWSHNVNDDVAKPAAVCPPRQHPPLHSLTRLCKARTYTLATSATSPPPPPLAKGPRNTSLKKRVGRDGDQA